MSVLDRIRDWADAPRFCPDDGKPIEVENLPSFDPRTGAPRDRWVWHCPKVSVEASQDSFLWSQSGDVIHVRGRGRPAWDRADKERRT